MGKIHIHLQKRWMTWAGTPDEDRSVRAVTLKVATVPIVIVIVSS
jgi:hypothetical protein